MRNDLMIKATWFVNKEKQNEIYFDYFNKEGNFVGNIIVGEIGTIEWHIIDANYQEDLFAVINYINDNKEVSRLDYKEKELDTKVWDRVKIFIQQKNIILNRHPDNYFSLESTKKR